MDFIRLIVPNYHNSSMITLRSVAGIIQNYPRYELGCGKIK